MQPGRPPLICDWADLWRAAFFVPCKCKIVQASLHALIKSLIIIDPFGSTTQGFHGEQRQICRAQDSKKKDIQYLSSTAQEISRWKKLKSQLLLPGGSKASHDGLQDRKFWKLPKLPNPFRLYAGICAVFSDAFRMTLSDALLYILRFVRWSPDSGSLEDLDVCLDWNAVLGVRLGDIWSTQRPRPTTYFCVSHIWPYTALILCSLTRGFSCLWLSSFYWRPCTYLLYRQFVTSLWFVAGLRLW